jgi:Tol biopolymer transport system component
MSADGRLIAFESDSSNLVPGDTNAVSDVFVHDRDTGTTTRVSVGSGGEQANGASGAPSMSADGRLVAFDSMADNLVPGDANGVCDVFVYDRDTGATTCVSVGSAGQHGDGYSGAPAISANGRFVAFTSDADNLTPGDTNEDFDVFVYDRDTGTTTRVSVGSGGEQANGASWAPSMSANGRYVAFDSYADNLVPADTEIDADVFVHDRQTHKTALVSTTGTGGQGDDFAGGEDPSISADGRFVAYQSTHPVVPGDVNQTWDVFVYDRETGMTACASVSSSGDRGDGFSVSPAISANGRFVAFISDADNLVPVGNGWEGVFINDRETRTTALLSSDAEAGVGAPCISADGGLVAFESGSDNLVPGDTNEEWDIFVQDRQTTVVAGSPAPEFTSKDGIYRVPLKVVHGVPLDEDQDRLHDVLAFALEQREQAAWVYAFGSRVALDPETGRITLNDDAGEDRFIRFFGDRQAEIDIHWSPWEPDTPLVREFADLRENFAATFRDLGTPLELVGAPEEGRMGGFAGMNAMYRVKRGEGTDYYLTVWLVKAEPFHRKFIVRFLCTTGFEDPAGEFAKVRREITFLPP